MGLNLFTIYNFMHNTEIRQENTASLEKKKYTEKCCSVNEEWAMPQGSKCLYVQMIYSKFQRQYTVNIVHIGKKAPFAKSTTNDLDHQWRKNYHFK